MSLGIQKMEEAPDIAAARCAIEEIRRLDLRLTSFDDLRTRLWGLLTGYRVAAPRFEPGFRVFRARVCEKPAKVSEISYPPPERTPLGRCNRPGVPIFYGSTSREPPFFEARPTPGATIALAQWVTTQPMLLNHLAFTRPTFERLGSKREQAGWAREAAEIPPGMQELAYLLGELFAASIGVGEEHSYLLTAALTSVMSDADVFDGLMYPSVAMWANGNNIALKTGFVDRALKFDKIEFARVERVKETAYDISWLDTAAKIADDGTIQWRGRLENWSIREPFGQLTFTAENGGWIARDAEGNVVEPE
jgi:hypothetical protein